MLHPGSCGRSPSPRSLRKLGDLSWRSPRLDNHLRGRFGPEICRTAYAFDSAIADVGLAGFFVGNMANC
jgi:hypothetical protein